MWERLSSEELISAVQAAGSPDLCKIAAAMGDEPVVAAFQFPKPVVIPKSLASLLAMVRAHAPAV